MTRGPYKTKRKKAKAETVNAFAKLPYNEFVAKYFNEMTVKSEVGRLTLAEAAATLRISLKMLLKKQAENTASSDEVRIIPAMTSNLRRILESGGMLEEKFEPDEEEF